MKQALPAPSHQPPVRARARRVAQLAGLCAVLALAACGSSDDEQTNAAPPPADPEMTMVSGDAACGGGGCGGDGSDGGGVGSGADGGDGAGGGLGEMRNIIVTARKPDGTVLASAKLQNNLVSIYDRKYKGAFVLEFADDGSGTGEYFDEGNKAWVRLQGQTLHVMVPLLTHHVSVNPLSEAAYQWAIAKYGSRAALTAERMTLANNTVRDAFNARVPLGYRVSDITNYAQAVSDKTVPGTLANTHAGRYSTLLAALPRAALAFAPGLRAPALSFARQLVSDVQDDDVVNSSVARPDAYGVDLPARLAEALASARLDYANLSQPAPQAAPTACFNPAKFVVGTKWALVYDEVAGQDGSFQLATRARAMSFNGLVRRPSLTAAAGTESLLNLEVTRITPASFANFPSAVEVKITDKLTAPTSELFSYFGTDFSKGLVYLGFDTKGLLSDSQFRILQVNKPAFTSRQFLLGVGETETITITAEQTFLSPVDGSVIVPPQTVQVLQTTRFAGYEDVTVLAGTFKQACKYEQLNPNGGVSSTTWITSSGQGVELKTVDDTGFISQLKSGTVDGKPVR
jgi:hypothetical protein